MSFRRRSSRQSLALYGQKKLTGKSIKPTQKTKNTIIYYLRAQAYKRNTNLQETHTRTI